MKVASNLFILFIFIIVLPFFFGIFVCFFSGGGGGDYFFLLIFNYSLGHMITIMLKCMVLMYKIIYHCPNITSAGL